MKLFKNGKNWKLRTNPITISSFSCNSLPSLFLSHQFKKCLYSTETKKITKIESPTKDWKPKTKIETFTETVTLNLDEMNTLQKYMLLIGSIVPRPIAFISTISNSGITNVAPFSFFNGVASNPPSVMIAIVNHPKGGPKDTLRNILETKQFVVNTASEWMAQAVNFCSADFPYGVSEIEEAGLTPIPSIKISPPRISESAIQLECKLYDKMLVGREDTQGSSTIVVGEIVAFHIKKEVLFVDEKGKKKIDLEKLAPIARLAGFSYSTITEIFDITRPK